MPHDDEIVPSSDTVDRECAGVALPEDEQRDCCEQRKPNPEPGPEDTRARHGYLTARTRSADDRKRAAVNVVSFPGAVDPGRPLEPSLENQVEWCGGGATEASKSCFAED